MNQFPAGTSYSPVPELNFMSDWTKSFPLVVETITAAPIPVAAILGIVGAQILLPNVPGWELLRSLVTFFVIAKLIQNTYKYLVPESRDRAELFPANPEFKMIGASIVLGIGTLIGCFFFIVPGIWFSLVHMMTLEIIALEGCSIFEAMGRSRQLMAGNLWSTATYCYLLPFAITVVAFIPLCIGAVIVYFCGGSMFHGESGTTLFRNLMVGFLTVIMLPLSLSFRTLAVRAFVHLMHKAGVRTSIEQQLSGNQIGMG